MTWSRARIVAASSAAGAWAIRLKMRVGAAKGSGIGGHAACSRSGMHARSLRWLALVGSFSVAACGATPDDGQTDDQLVDGPHFTTQAELQSGKFDDILRYWNDHVQRGSFAGTPRPDGVQPNIAYDVVAPDGESQGAILIVHGLDESSIKYAEFVYDLQMNGLPLTAYLINHRGQGFSDRLLADPMKCYVDRFENYVADLDTFVNDVVKPSSQRNAVAFGHSMGGGILTRYLEEHPQHFQTVVLSSPMEGVNTNWLLGGVAQVLADSVANLDPTGYLPGSLPKGPYTTSPERDRDAVKLAELHPEIKLGNPTWGWLRESLDTTRGPLRRDAAAVTAKIKLLRAKPDDLVDTDAEDAVCNLVEQNGQGHCTIESFSNAKHEIWNERDEVRDVVLKETIAFFRQSLR